MISILSTVAIAVVLIALAVAGFIAITKLFLLAFGAIGSLLAYAGSWLLGLAGLAIILAIHFSRTAA